MCGVFGIALQQDCFKELKWGTSHLQLRGEEFGGFSILRNGEIYTEASRGWVRRLFEQKEAESPEVRTGKMAIGHVSLQDPQPVVIQDSKIGSFSIVFNGKIVNRNELQQRSPHLVGSDAEVLARLIAEGKDYLDGLENIYRVIRGAFSLVLLSPERVFACRDPFGFKPLVLGKSMTGCAVASESESLNQIGMDRIRDVRPGEIVQIDTEGFSTLKQMPSERLAICAYEYGFLARPSSIIEDVPVGKARYNMGVKLAQGDNIEADIVAAIPLSGISAAEGYHGASRIPFQNVFEYNPFIGRASTALSQQEGMTRVKAKLSPIQWAAVDKRIVLVDDCSILGRHRVKIYSLISSRPKEVHFRLACPPVKAICPFDFLHRTPGALPAATSTVEEMRKRLGVKSLKFNTVEDFVESIIEAQGDIRKERSPLKAEDFCLGCFTGEYPIHPD